jgi:hypothetical protein
MVGLVQALASTVRPPEQRESVDAFGQLERTLSLLAKVKKFAGADGASESESSTGGLLGGGGIEQMLMAKLLGGDGPPQQQAPPAYGPTSPQPTPQHLWHPQAGWVLPRRRTNAPPVAAQPGAPQPQPHAPPPSPQPPPPAPSQPAAVAPVVAPVPVDDEPDDDDDDDELDDPMSPEEMAEEVAAMGPEEQQRFMAAVLQKTGADPGTVAAMAAGPKPSANAVDVVDSPPDEPPSPPVSLDTTYPIAASEG